MQSVRHEIRVIQKAEQRPTGTKGSAFLLTIVMLAALLLSACGTGGWVDRNLINPVYYVDRSKETEKLVRQVESRPTTKLILNNKSSIVSRVVVDYRDVAGVRQHDTVTPLIYKNFQLVYDILPGEKVEVTVPCRIEVKIGVHNDIFKQRREQTINTGSRFFSAVIDATPPGALTGWRSERKCMLTFINRTGHEGKVQVENLSALGDPRIDIQRTEDEYSVGVRRKVTALRETPHILQMEPGRIEHVHLSNGIYQVSLLGHRTSHHFMVQVSDGRPYDREGNRLPSLFEIPRRPGDPDPDAIPVNVPNR